MQRNVCPTPSIDARETYSESNKDNELHERLDDYREGGMPQNLSSFPKSTARRTTLRLSSGLATREDLQFPLTGRPFTLRSALAIATGRASRSLMRPAVERHHRSSRALTQDAPTLRDLLIFEIARPGMFI